MGRVEMSPDYPYNLPLRLLVVAAMAVVVALIITLVLFPAYLIAASIVSPVLWLLIAWCLKKRPKWTYLAVGAASPFVGAPFVVALTEVFTDGLTSPMGLADGNGNDLIGGFYFGIVYSIPFGLLTFSIGMAMGYLTFQFMRKDSGYRCGGFPCPTARDSST